MLLGMERDLHSLIAEVGAAVERLERAVASTSPYPSDDAISRAARCEMAHLRIGAEDLGRAIGKATTTANYRIKGTYRFRREELPDVAALVGVSLAQFLELAVLHDKAAEVRRGARLHQVKERDPWILPGRRRKKL